MNDLAGSGSFMKIIPVLCDHCHVILVFKFCDNLMGMIGFPVEYPPPDVIKEVKNLLPPCVAI